MIHVLAARVGTCVSIALAATAVVVAFVRTL
jgi:hypothetical protein